MRKWKASRAVVLVGFILGAFPGLAQQRGILRGSITNSTTGESLAGVNIYVEELQSGTVSDQQGIYRLTLPADSSLRLRFSFIGYENVNRVITLAPGEERVVDITMKEQSKLLQEVQVQGQVEDIRDQVSMVKLDPKSVENLPSPFGDFNKILSTLPGVFSNNELSSAYSVRGGNFDENLVYVNDIPVYRPFLVNNGRQEGLSFINPDLVESVSFSSGGWQPRYGDKLSSVLDVKYKDPKEFSARMVAGLLGGSVSVQGANPERSISFAAGARHKRAEYLLNTLETDGQYLPRFTDVQSVINFDLRKLLGKKEGEGYTTLSLLTYYGRNRYLFTPENRETDFGTFNRSLRLFVAFIGNEVMEYDIYQSGIKLSHRFSPRLHSDFIISGVNTQEREFRDTEGGYRLCDLDNNPGSNSFNQCAIVRGIGTNFEYSRNTLEANIVNAEWRNRLELDGNQDIQFGFGFNNQQIDDFLNEYSFTDSADFVTNIQQANTENSTQAKEYTGYLQHRLQAGKYTFTYGIRTLYRDLNEQWLFSPRAQVSFRPEWSRDFLFKFAAGLYQQPPFYREMRDFEGNLNEQLKAQRSLHLIGGVDYNFPIWGRSFKFLGELYYKRIWDVVTYDVDNVRLRYYANNDATAFATGIDLRVSGEFIPGAESWFSLGLLSTQEDVEGDEQGFIRRPSDQRINLGIFFQDHLPNNPTMRVSLNVLFGGGLPFGPPNDFQNRNVFVGDSYRRLDVAFIKIFRINKHTPFSEKYVSLSAEVLNLLGAANAISYTWIDDVVGSSFAVPNSLSARFLNIRVSVKI